jgi:hypothetical protein
MLFSGLIRWGIVIHGFIDGYSRLITGLRASNNNLGDTVLHIFLAAAEVYGVPSRLRGDHGIENILLAAWMELNRGVRRGSYIWGRHVIILFKVIIVPDLLIINRSVHNVRIERLWVDVTVQVGAFWAEIFIQLELHHGFDINSANHIWLLHHLFLPIINQQLAFFAESWNQHRIQIRNGPNRSPADMFGFDMFVHGVRGHQLPAEEHLTEEELEVYGVDWEGLHDERLLQSQQQNNPGNEGWSSWVGHVGPPEHLNGVSVDPPADSLQIAQVEVLDQALQPWYERMVHPDDNDIIALWTTALAYSMQMSNVF